MTLTSPSDIYYDPFDIQIDIDPHPLWKRMRDEAPLYRNEKYTFFALSRYDDVEKALVDWDNFRSGKGSTLEMILAGIEMPSGSILMEDPPRHDVHRGLMSRVFTPKAMLAIEPKVRAFCRPRSPTHKSRTRYCNPRARSTDSPRARMSATTSGAWASVQ